MLYNARTSPALTIGSSRKMAGVAVQMIILAGQMQARAQLLATCSNGVLSFAKGALGKANMCCCHSNIFMAD